MLTKRNLLIIIGLLFLLDLAAIFVYVISHTNSEGKSPIDFVLNDSILNETKDSERDTFPTKLDPAKLFLDKFDTIARSQSFVSKDMIPVAGKLKPMTCSVKMKFVWPKSINDETSLNDLYKELISRISSDAPSDISDAVEWVLENPEFVQPSSNFVTAAAVNSLDTNCYTEQMYRIFPYISSDNLLEMVVMVEKLKGKSLSRKMNVVHYDRVHHNVIDYDEVFNISKASDILALINRNIEIEKKKGNHSKWHATSTMPTDFLLGDNNVVFLFTNGEIAPWDAGLHQIEVANQELMPYFTNFFIDLLKKDNNLKVYPFVTF